MSGSESTKSYAQLMKEVQDATRSVQNCDDVDEAIAIFERACACLSACEAKLETAQGKFEKIVNSSTQSTLPTVSEKC